MSQPRTRYPIEPLAQALGIELTAPGTFGGCNDARGVPELAERLGCSIETIYRFRRAGGMSALNADRYAMGAGIHPARIWPSWWADIDDTNTEHGEIGCTCDDDHTCTCGYYADDPPMDDTPSHLDLAA